MSVHVYALTHNGWQGSGRNGRPAQRFHMFSATENHDELDAIALKIGQKHAWFRSGGRRPHYDLTPGKRAQSVTARAIPVGRSLAVRIWRAQRPRSHAEDTR